MNRMKMQTPDITESNIEKIGQLFPNCLTERIGEDGKVERVIDFDQLRQELSREIVEGPQERYQFTWPDKKKSIRTANAPTSMTLRPYREESVSFDDTQNLYIEGDNLESLKLLRETYYNRIQVIYIDPPYNTGSDSLVYDDDFVSSLAAFSSRSGQYDENGQVMYDIRVNNDNNGRFHTDWLNMLYPRLKVAKDLLSETGVLFISIDEHEIANAKKLCEDIFGIDNILGVIANINNPKGRSDDKFIATAHEYIIVVAKNINKVIWGGFEPTEEITKRYNKIDENGKKYREIDLRKTGENDLREDRPNLFYYFYYNEKTKEFYPSRILEEKPGFITIKPQREDGKEGNWRWGMETAEKQLSELIPKFMPSRKVWGVMQKDYLDGRALVKPTSAWTFKDVNSERGTEDFIKLGFDKRIFPKPKPLGTINRCLLLASDKNSIVLDFFSGSSTTAQAVMNLNAGDGGQRKFIMMQLPEETEKGSEAYKAGYRTICDIGKERIRRAGKKILEEQEKIESDGGLFAQTESKPKLDVGFRVLKLDSSNMEDVYYRPEDASDTTLFEDNIKPDRTPEDLLFQVMLECNLPLSAKIETMKIAGKEVFCVNNGYLVACFDADVNEEVIKAVAKRKPYYFIMRDSSLASDNVADNFEQIFQAYSKDTIRRIL